MFKMWAKKKTLSSDRLLILRLDELFRSTNHSSDHKTIELCFGLQCNNGILFCAHKAFTLFRNCDMIVLCWHKTRALLWTLNEQKIIMKNYIKNVVLYWRSWRSIRMLEIVSVCVLLIKIYDFGHCSLKCVHLTFFMTFFLSFSFKFLKYSFFFISHVCCMANFAYLIDFSSWMSIKISRFFFLCQTKCNSLVLLNSMYKQ